MPPMGERRELAVTLIVMSLIVFLSYIAYNYDDIYTEHFAGWVVEQYSANLTRGGALYENYTYDVREGHGIHTFHRRWSMPLWYVPSHSMGIFVMNVSVRDLNGHPVRAIPYARDGYGSVWLLNNVSYESAMNYIMAHARKNEVGVYFPYALNPGRYVVSYEFLLKPLLNYDGHNYMFSFYLATIHPQYRNVDIHLPGNFRVFSSPYLKEKRIGGEWVFYGKSPYDVSLHFTVLFGNAVNFSHYGVNGVKGNLLESAERASLFDSLGYWTVYYTALIAYLSVLFIPGVYLLAYLSAGRERDYPFFGKVYYPPSERPPFIVNYIFKNEGAGVDYDWLILASLLELQRHGYVEISEDGGRILIKDGGEGNINQYSWKVLNFLKKHAKDGVFDVEGLRRWVGQAHVKDMDEYFSYIADTQELVLDVNELNKIEEKFIVYPKTQVKALSYFGLGLMASSFVAFLYPDDYIILWFSTFALAILMSVQALLILLYRDVLGRWREDYYMEKLKWERFASFLKDENELKNAYKELRDYYYDWLIYGYGLGAGKKVSRFLSSPDVNFAPAKGVEKLRPNVIAVFLTFYHNQ